MDKSHIFSMSHEIICKYLEYSRKTDIKFKGNKSWDMIKWNAYENLYISECALEKLQSSNENLVLIKSKREFNGSIKRCFTLEHIFPTKCLINFFYQIFEENNPKPDQTQLILSTLNACCYVWQDENINIAKSGLNSDIYPDKREVDYRKYFSPSSSIESNRDSLEELRSIRYKNVNPCIMPLETRCQTKELLNKLIMSGETFLI
tara:strand:- start:1381 stop:1995 length:615 start_codon:yes stop_codon:yes gene_type:complete